MFSLTVVHITYVYIQTKSTIFENPFFPSSFFLNNPLIKCFSARLTCVDVMLFVNVKI